MATAAQHWRLRFTAGNGEDIWLSEVEFYDALDAKLSATGAGAISSGDYTASYGAALAFDGVKTTASNGWASSTIPAWLGQSFASPVSVAKVLIYLAPQASAFDELPTQGYIYLEYSTDLVTWTGAAFSFTGTFAIGEVLTGVPEVPPTAVLRPSFISIDTEFGGPDTVSGTTQRKVGGTLTAQKAKVSLFRLRDKALARQTWSDPDTGEVSFPGIDTSVNRFLMLAEYPSNPDNPSADEYLRPVAGVSLKRGGS